MARRTDDPDTLDRDERLGEAVEAYLSLAEKGQAPDPEAFAASYPDLSGDLRSALDGLAMVQGLVGSSPNGAGRRLEAGHRVAGYKIVRELGRGGMGVVYEAVHVDLDRPVALKILGSHAAPGSRGRRRFLNEAKTAASLHHTHIVPVFDVGQVGGLCYYAMQRIEGSGLDRVLRALRRDRSTASGSGSSRRAHSVAMPTLPDGLDASDSALWSASELVSGLVMPGGGSATGSWPSQRPAARPPRADAPPPYTPPTGSEYYRWVARVGQQAADALAYAHSRGVIHRDIKPSNLLVDAKGTIWVADFGLARRVEDPSLTRADSLLGTPRYMSPEQAEGLVVETKTDLYSLGATLYELLTLRPPFEGQTAAELIRQITGREAPPLRPFDLRIPRDLETIVLKAMAKRPADRYESSAELADDLARFLATEPVRARRISPFGRFWRFTRRHPAVSAVSAAATAAILTIATIAYVRVADERDRAVALQGELEEALGAADLARVEDNLSNAVMARKSAEPNRREMGLEKLAQAAALHPNPATRLRLRDEALELLALRDVVPGSATLPTGEIRGLLVLDAAGQSARLATLSDADDRSTVSFWDPAGRAPRSIRPLTTADPSAAAGEPILGRERGGRGGRFRFFGPQLAAVGRALVAVPSEGPGLLRLDPVSGVVTVLPLDGNRLLGVFGSTDGRRLVTVETAEAEPADPVELRGPPEPGPGQPPLVRLRVALRDAAVPDAPPLELDHLEYRRAGRSPYNQPWPQVAIDPAGVRLVSGWSGQGELKLWDLRSGEALATIDTGLALTAVALGPDGLLAAAGDGKVLLWQVEPDRTVPLPGLGQHQGLARLLRFSRDGRLLAVVGLTTGVELWDPASNSRVANLPTTSLVADVAFAGPRSVLVAAAEGTGAWRLVEPVGEVRFEFPSANPARDLDFGPDGRLVIELRDAAPRLWQPDQCPTLAHEWSMAKNRSVVYDADGRLGLVGQDGLEWYDDPHAAPIATVAWPVPPVEAGGGPSATRLLARAADGRAIVFAREFRRAPLSEGGDQLEGPDRSREGRRNPASAGQILLWRAGPGGGSIAALRLPPLGRNDPRPSWGGMRLSADRQAILLDPGGGRLVFLGSDRPEVWRLDESAGRVEIASFPTPIGPASCLALSHDGRTLAVGRETGEVTLIDAVTGAVRARINPSAAPTVDAARRESGGPPSATRVSALAFDEADRLMAVGGARGDLDLWSLETAPARLLRLPGRRGFVNNLAFDATGRRLAASDLKFAEQNSAEVWDLAVVRRELGRIGLGW